MYDLQKIETLKYGKNNIFIYDSEQNKYVRFLNNIKGLNIVIDENNVENCLIVIDKKSKFKNSKIIVNNCYSPKIFISENNQINNLFINVLSGMNQICCIGKNNIIYGMSITLADMHQVAIENDCLLGAGLVIRAGQSHSYYDIHTKKFFNSKKECIRIGNHVWVALNVMFTGKASINNNCIVGARSLVTRNIKETYSIIAGNPAKVVRSDVEWDYKTPLLTITKLYCENNNLNFSWKYAENALKQYEWMFND